MFDSILCHPFSQSWLPGGLVARIRRFHRRGPGSIPGQGKLEWHEEFIQTNPLWYKVVSV